MTSHLTSLSGYWELTQIIYLHSAMLMMVTATSDTWTGGSVVEGDVSLVCVAGAGEYSKNKNSSNVRLFCAVLGPLQTVQTAEIWCVVIALQARTSVHIGGDNLNVVRDVGKILDGLDEHRPLP